MTGLRNFRLDYMPDGETIAKGVDFYLTDADLDLSSDDLINRIFAPGIKCLLDNIRMAAGKPTEHDLMVAEAKRLLGTGA